MVIIQLHNAAACKPEFTGKCEGRWLRLLSGDNLDSVDCLNDAELFSPQLLQSASRWKSK